MKFRVPEIVLGVLLAVAVFAMGYVVASSVQPPSQQIEKTSHGQAADEGAERTSEKQIAYYTKWLAWFTGALVIVAGLQGYFLLRADKTARIVATAADLSARAAIAPRSPLIIRQQPASLWLRSIHCQGLMLKIAGFTTSNFGTTEALGLSPSKFITAL